IRQVLDRVFPTWDEYVDWSLLLERRSFMYLFLSVNALIFLLLLRVFLAWLADHRLQAPRFHLRANFSRATAAFFTSPEINSRVCGICGFAYASNSKEAESRVRAMAGAMRHRGPDDDGFLANDPRAPGLALGMRRLSIIDIAGGHQTVWNESANVAVIFNGELYNYRELRERLLLAGHRFATQSDTEILVHGWEEWGEDLLGELHGMF